jgi:hypothetical protein
LTELRQHKISKILVAVDGSEESMLAADCAIDMSKKNNAELIVLNVIHSQKYLYSPSYAWRPVIPSTTNSIIKNSIIKDQEESVVKRNPNKEALYVHTPYRSTSISGFLNALTIGFNPEKARGITMTIHFEFVGKEVSFILIVSDGKLPIQEGIVGNSDLKVYIQTYNPGYKL